MSKARVPKLLKHTRHPPASVQARGCETQYVYIQAQQFVKQVQNLCFHQKGAMKLDFSVLPDSNIDRKSCLTASWSPPYSALWFWQQLQSLVASRRSRSIDSSLDAPFYRRNFRRLFKIYPQVVASLANYYCFFLLFLLGDSLFHVKAVVCVRLWLITIIEQPCMR